MSTLPQNLFLFRNLDFEAIDQKYSVKKRIQTLHFEDGEQILSSNGGEKGIFTVTEGKSKIVSVSKKHNAPLRYLSVGDTFGAASLYGPDIAHRTKVIAIGKTTTSVIPAELTDELIRNESTVAFNYIEFLSERVSFLNRKIAAFSAGSTDEKFALYLLSLPFDDGCCTLNESYTDIAKGLDVGRASLYRSIEIFEKSGIIRREGRMIRLCDKQKLIDIIE